VLSSQPLIDVLPYSEIADGLAKLELGENDGESA